MNFLSNLTKSDDDAQPQKVPDAKDGGGAQAGEARHKPTTSDLIHSAQVVAGAAQAHFRSEPEKFDKGEVAGAAADLIDAASDYAKLDDKQGIGMYVDKAEDYLRHYKGADAPAAKPEAAGSEGAEKKADDGGLMKMAGDFLKK
ncbi:nodulin-related protein 2 [Salvia hispanica]|uniref:nodulin-related protein 2 n=1 Tax=Salvia hispanica TaxID=49212 RepID=UPI002009B14E|nr:nodulin-related protein 2 [Salvia hispanica]